MLTVRKTWVPPSKKYEDPHDLALTSLQIVSSPEAKQAGVKRMQELHDAKKYVQVLDIALEWPLYFSLVFPCVDQATQANELAVDHRAVHLVDTTKSKEPVKTSSFQDLGVSKVTPKSLDITFGSSIHHVEGSGFAIDSKIKSVLAEIRKNSKWAIATRDHDVNDWSLLPFRKGDVIELIEKEEDSGWFRGEIGERSGWFPKESIEIMFGKPTPKQVEEAKVRMGGTTPRPTSYAAPTRPESPGPEPVSKPPPVNPDLAKMPMPAMPVAEATPELDDSVIEPRTRKDSTMSVDNETPIPEDTSSYTIFEYAKMYFRVDMKMEENFDSRGSMRGTLKRLTVKKDKKNDEMKEILQKLKYSKEPIKMSLHKSLDVTDNKMATDLFMVVMSYMGDYPSKNNHSQLVQTLVAGGLKKELLRDEIYCQILKQVTNNKSSKKDSAKRGWDLMAICCSAFPPSEVLLPYLINAFQQLADSKDREHTAVAADCIKRLHKVAKHGPRKIPPAPAEIQSIETSTPMSMRVHFPGDASRMLMIDSGTTAEEVMQKASAKIQIKNPERFGLFVVSTVGGSLPILPTDYILDVLNVAERLAAAAGMATMKKKDNTPGTPAFHIVCKKKLWIDAKKDLESDMLAVMLYYQLKSNYLAGNLFSAKELQPDSQKVIGDIAALQIKAEGGADQNQLANLDFFRTVIPLAVYATKDANAWRNQVMQSYLKLDGDNDLLYKKKFVEALDKFQLFGNTFFDIKSSTDSRLPNGGILAVGTKGLIILDRVTRATLLTCTFDTIVNFRFDDSEFVMKTGDLMTKAMLRLQTKEGFEIADLIQAYIQEQVNMQSTNQGIHKKYSAF